MLFPLVLQRTIAKLARVSVAGLLVLFFGLAVVTIYGVASLGFHAPSPRLLAMPTFPQFAEFFGIAGFSFGLQSTLLSVQAATH